MAFPTGYTLYQNVTIDNTQVDATLTDYPCFVDLSDMVKAGDDVFDTCRTDGGDIRVTLTDGTTQLAREIVSIDTTAKTGEMHVKIPSLASGTDTVIRIWYNGTDTEPAEDSTYGSENTWNSDFEVVSHLNDLTTSTVKDSTSHGRDGTKAGANTPIEISGKIGQAQDFNPTTEYISFPATVIGQATFSVQFWEYSNGTTNEGYFLSDSNDATNLLLRRGGGGGPNDYDGTIGDAGFTDFPIGRTAWKSSTVTHDSSGNIEWFVSGGSITTVSGSNFASLNNALYLGNRQPLDRSFDGLLDAFRVSSVELLSGWISTEYNNQSSPSTFYSVSDEQISGASATLTGTAITGGVTESEIVTGGETIIITLTGDTWVATVGADNAITDALILGITSAQSETNGWNNVVRANMVFGDVARTSDTIVTITLAAEAAYSITSNETITITIPATALTAAGEVVATPNIIVANESAGGMVKRLVDDGLLQGLTVGRLVG